MGIKLCPYSKEWVKKFEQIKRQLDELPFALTVEHIGSTAVPGLMAKPVIDVLVGAERLERELVKAIQSLGYEYVPEFEAEIPDRRFLKKTDEVHLHVVDKGGAFWKRHLFFRDYLREHAEERLAYQELKVALAKKHEDRRAYTGGKTAFIQRIEQQMPT